MSLIRCEDLSLGYEGHAIISNLNFHVESGDYLCIVGENGSGKSTLMRTMLGLLTPLSGTVTFGDGLNDLDMLKWAGTACAMKNAVSEVKAAADIVAPSNDQDGVAQIVQGLITAGMIGGGVRG